MNYNHLLAIIDRLEWGFSRSGLLDFLNHIKYFLVVSFADFFTTLPYFLSQDRVVEFAKMSQQELLIATEKAVSKIFMIIYSPSLQINFNFLLHICFLVILTHSKRAECKGIWLLAKCYLRLTSRMKWKQMKIVDVHTRLKWKKYLKSKKVKAHKSEEVKVSIVPGHFGCMLLVRQKHNW